MSKGANRGQQGTMGAKRIKQGLTGASPYLCLYAPDDILGRVERLFTNMLVFFLTFIHWIKLHRIYFELLLEALRLDQKQYHIFEVKTEFL